MRLSESNYIGSGIAKIVYRHPDDPSICIKFPNPKKKRAKHDILREISYLKKHQNHIPWLCAYLGEIQCDEGIGYMYELARNEDGSLSQSIEYGFRDKKPDTLKLKIAAMYDQLIRQHAVVNDMSLSNMYIHEKRNGDYDLVLIDGFGNNNWIKIADYSKIFLISKLNRKFTSLCKGLQIPADFLCHRAQLIHRARSV